MWFLAAFVGVVRAGRVLRGSGAGKSVRAGTEFEDRTRSFADGSDVRGQRAEVQAEPRSLFFVMGRMTGRQEGRGRGQLRKEDPRSPWGHSKRQMCPTHPSGGQPPPHTSTHTNAPRHTLYFGLFAFLSFSLFIYLFCLRIFLEDLFIKECVIFSQLHSVPLCGWSVHLSRTDMTQRES